MIILFWIYLFHGLFSVSHGKLSRYDSQLQKLKSKAEEVHHSRRKTAWQQCSNHPQSVSPQILQLLKYESLLDTSGSNGDEKSSRGRRATGGTRTMDTAIFVDRSRGQLNTVDTKLPDHEFTLSLWCKPIGGQNSPAVVLELKNLCQPFPNRGWVLGIHSPETGGEKNMRFYFSLHVWSKPEASILTSPLPMLSSQWTNIAITFNGTIFAMYLNGAQVALTSSQASLPSGGLSCSTLWLGGDSNHHFRGNLDDLQIWDKAFSAEDVRKLLDGQRTSAQPRPKMAENFSKLESWDWARGTGQQYALPQLVYSDVSKFQNQVHLNPHQCALTICDYPEIQKSYKDHSPLRLPKVLRYRVIVLSNNDGTKPIVTKEQIRQQHDYLQRAFEPYNITWELDELLIRNSSLRTKTVLLSCYASMVGNGQCESECRHPSTGNDGGDCGVFTTFRRRNDLRYAETNEEQCSPSMLGDGVCDESCNIAEHRWDGGDCCSPDNPISKQLCHDPNSPNKSYMHIKELKSFLKLKNNGYINVLFAQWSNRDILGVATFPWEKDVFTEFGGIVLRSSEYGTPGHMSTLVHELGHSLGLWHVHRGISEMDCNHPCYEKESSPIHGDLCSDTTPTPENLHCQDPPQGTQEVCGRSHFKNTPFTNFMGYADDSCVQDFTPDQVARMHCYIDRTYNSISKKHKDHKPSPPLLLSAIGKSSTSVTLSWLPSLSLDGFYDTNICGFCSDSLELSQFAYKVESYKDTVTTEGLWTSDEVIGAPDAEQCMLSYKVWLPDSERCPNNICMLTVYFQTPAIPSLLELWVTWNAHQSLKEIELVFEDGTTDAITNLPAQCDTTLSIPLFYSKQLSKINIHPAHRFVGIDAIRLVSMPNNPRCSPCKPIRYKLWREPPFTSGDIKEVDYNVFTDMNILPDQNYSYKVQSWLGSRVTAFSPTLHFNLNSEICGDGKIDKSESCDDGNTINGDGCSSSCHIENLFHCKGEPSLCYWPEGDGYCESFEKESSVSDCGFYTPDGFTDQWSHTIETGPGELPVSCSPDVIAGPPTLPLECRNEQSTSVATWTPCDFQSTFWLLAKFPKPVVATSVIFYLSSDGSTNDPFQDNSKSFLQLLDSEGNSHHNQNFEFSCNSMPQKVQIIKDISEPFTKTAAINISSSNMQVTIAAIRLRSSDVLSPVDVGHCRAGQLYHPGLQQCNGYCSMPQCPILHTKNGIVNCTGQNDGDVCIIACGHGHVGQKTAHPMVCQAGHWKGEDPNCKPLDCGNPLLAHADAMCPEGTTYGKTCSYKCRPPARFSGSVNGMASITCQANGQWSMPTFACQLNCASPLPPSHTVLASSRCRKAESFSFGETCKFRCKVGYHVEGYNMRKRILYLRCDATASWSGAECVPVTCLQIQSGHYNCTLGNTVGSDCSVSCPNSKQIATPSIHICELDGSWSPELPQCNANLQCPIPTSSDPKVIFSCDGSKVGAICKTMCSSKDEQTTNAQNNVEKVKIKCQGNGEWQPSPNDIQCKKKCMPNFIGDGFCDVYNNQIQCEWDGGDCCESTVHKAVQFFPPDCGEACSCKDPTAIENSHPRMH